MEIELHFHDLKRSGVEVASNPLFLETLKAAAEGAIDCLICGGLISPDGADPAVWGWTSGSRAVSVNTFCCDQCEERLGLEAAVHAMAKMIMGQFGGKLRQH